MCGIAGELSQDAPADVAAVARMVAALAPRGPDGAGLWSQGRLALGHRRLKIIDLSERGAQPMVDPGLGLALVFNGCIYNHRELRAELERAGYAFFSTSDTEVVLKAYHRWGERCVERFLGMFAFVVAERDSGRVVLARDRLGIKPLYLADDGNRLRFASTLPALLRAGGVDSAIDHVALHHFLSWHSVVPPPRTILAGVRKLPPATVMTVAPDGSRTSWCYWKPSFDRDPERAGWSGEDWGRAVLDSLRTAVSRRTVADVPVGVLLSGGVDSSVIVALLAEQPESRLKTFSVGFPTIGARVGKSSSSPTWWREFGTDHQRIEIEDGRLLPALEQAVRAMSEPMISHDAVAFHLVSDTPFLDHELVELAATCPPELKLAQGGKGGAQGRRPPRPAGRRDRPAEGLLPRAGAAPPARAYLALVREALTNEAARERGLFEPHQVKRLLDQPNSDRATLGGNTLWHLGLLELWLQTHGVEPVGHD